MNDTARVQKWADYCAENPELDFINKTLACKKRALHTKQALELTVWLLVNINDLLCL